MTTLAGARAAARSDARAVCSRVRTAWRRTSLRVRLVAGMLVLVVLALAGSGAVAAATLRGYLVQRVDDQLRGAAGAMLHTDGDDGHPVGGPLPGGLGGSPDNRDARLPSQFVRELLAANGKPVGGTLSNLVDGSQALPDFPHLTIAQARSRAGEPFTVGSTGGGERWRVVAVPLPDGSGTLMVASGLGDVNATVARLETIEIGIGLGTLVLVALAGGLVVRAALRPLREVEDTASAIAAGDLSRRVADDDPRTEVGRLGAAFNTMLSRIEQSFRAQAASEEEARRSEEKMRRFVADASHELRTPLTSIRGFAELHRLQRAAPSHAEPADVGRSMERIEAEASRMGLLVEDLLLLARLDQERPLAADPVDLLAVAADVVHDSSARAPDRAVRLVALPSAEPPVVAGDDARLRQVLTNLVDNALHHAPVGTPVEVRIGTDPTTPGDCGPMAVVEVVDHGRGLTDAEKGHVFERFWRADAARTRGDGGAGLGLAIVSALVDRHGGDVVAVDTPGGGATFRVRLPLQVG